MTWTALTNAAILDGTGAPPLTNRTVLIRDGRIHDLPHASGRLPDDAVVLDLGGMTVLPGLIDAHVHLIGHRTMDARDMAFVDPALRAVRATADLGRLLAAGITTVRDCGSATALALKQAVIEGSVPGPHIVACGRFIERTGGADDFSQLPVAWMAERGPWEPRLADGPIEVRKAVREQIRAGATWIKTCTTGAVTTQAASRPDRLEWTDEELAAIVDEAHRLDAPVAVHAHAAAGIHQALRCGADSIEHGTLLDDEAAREMAARGVFLVPTLFTLDRLLNQGVAFGVPPWAVAKARQIAGVRQASFERALRHGVPIAMGTDCGGQDLLPHGRNAREAELLVQSGMTPSQAIAAATADAARLLGIASEVGTIELGKAADLIAVDDDPLRDITALQRPAFVMVNGTVAHDRRRATAAAVQ
ncbi:MAG: amidohydrolase family protein [Thermomicrobiales bacterium]|nr:amidohydrolase family protein [Thermomicrobiales bacterium]